MTKLSTCILWLAFMPLLVASSSTQANQTRLGTPPNNDTVYYYFDHSCSCRPTADLPSGTYWIITEGVYQAEAGDLERLVEQYKRFLAKRFVPNEAMEYDVVIRYQATAALARHSRTQKIEKMRDQGYAILEVAFDPETDVEQ